MRGSFWAGLWPGLLIFVWFAGDGLFSGLFPDEMMNIYRVWSVPWPDLLRRLVWPAADDYRPLGALFYRPLFEVFGLTPFPYRLVCVALLISNLILSYGLVGLLTNSRVTAIASSSILAYHAYFADLYYSSATIYDLLCYALSFSCLLLVAYWRGRATRIGVRQLSIIAVLYWLALNAKEMALTLPVILLAYEQFYGRPKRDYRFAVTTAVLALIMLCLRSFGSSSLSSLSAYTPDVGMMVPNARRYLGMLFYVQGDLPSWLCVLVGAAVITLAVAIPDPAVRLAAVILIVMPLPILLIAPRSFYVCYLPYLGCALLVGRTFGLVAERWLSNAWQYAALGLLIFPLVFLHTYRKPYGNAWVPSEGSKVRKVVDGLNGAALTLPRGAVVRITDDPFDDGDWILTFLFRLKYRDPDLQVVRDKSPATSTGSVAAATCVLTLQDFRLQVVQGCR